MREETARRRLRYCVVLAAFAALFVALALLNIGVGSVSVGVDVYKRQAPP